MKLQKSVMQLLVLVEVIVFVVVLVFGMVNRSRAAVQSNNSGQTSYADSAGREADEIGDAAIYNDSESEPSSGEAEETDNTTVHNGLQPVVFSEEVEAKLADMTLEEKVAQMFWITPEALTHMDVVNVSRNGTRDAINAYPVGGLVYSAQNFQGNVLAVLGGNHHRIHPYRHTVIVFDGNMCFAVGTQVSQRAIITHLSQPLCQIMCQ